ncbi:MAG: barstar family protein [Paludibacteraceae bacterium]
MKQIIFNFENIKSIEDFYTEAKVKLALPEYFGNNLDALWDSVTSGIELPVDIRFVNLTSEQLEQFHDLILFLEDASVEMTDELFFEYSLKEDDEDLFYNNVKLDL